MHCTSDILTKARKLGVEKVEKSLYKFHTSPPLLKAILQGMLCWETSTEYDLNEESHPKLFNIAHTQLLNTQNKIGWAPTECFDPQRNVMELTEWDWSFVWAICQL